MAEGLCGSQDWADAVKDLWNKDQLTRPLTKGLTLKLWYMGLEWPGKVYGSSSQLVDVLWAFKFDDGFMQEFITDFRPAPYMEWRSLKFDKKGWWGGFTAGMNPALDAMCPDGSPPKGKEQLLQVLSDPRIRLDQSATAAYKVLKQLQAWLDGLARANKALEDRFPFPTEYVSFGPAPRPLV